MGEASALAIRAGRLLDVEPDTDSEHWVSVPTRQGVRLSFHHDEHYRPPVWPSRGAEQPLRRPGRSSMRSS